MVARKDMHKRIIDALSEMGSQGATIGELEKKVRCERHTLAKHLQKMKKENIVGSKNIGKANIWFLSNVSAKLALSSLSTSFPDSILYSILSESPIGIMVIDEAYNIHFMNRMMEQRYEDALGKKFYECVLGCPNPLKMDSIRGVVEGKDAGHKELHIADKNNSLLRIRATRIRCPEDMFVLVIDEQKKCKEMYSLMSIFNTADMQEQGWH
jgi:hypothetical protein